MNASCAAVSPEKQADLDGKLTIVRQLEGVVKWLRDLREVWPEGELGDDMRQIHHCEQFGQSESKTEAARLTIVVDMFPRRIAVPDGRDVEISWGA